LISSIVLSALTRFSFVYWSYTMLGMRLPGGSDYLRGDLVIAWDPKAEQYINDHRPVHGRVAALANPQPDQQQRLPTAACAISATATKQPPKQKQVQSGEQSDHFQNESIDTDRLTYRRN
jgi:hypothetical protein